MRNNCIISAFLRKKFKLQWKYRTNNKRQYERVIKYEKVNKNLTNDDMQLLRNFLSIIHSNWSVSQVEQTSIDNFGFFVNGTDLFITIAN